MRFWNPISNPDHRQNRQRSAIRGVPPASQFGQRPMFSRADQEQEPAQSAMAPESRLDDLVPTDEGPHSESRADLIGRNAENPVFLTYSVDNVSATPTEAEIEAVFGARGNGFIGFISDGGGAGKIWICLRYSVHWFFVGMTRAT